MVWNLSLAKGMVACALWATGGVALAQPVKVEVGFPPGGATDVLARLVAHEMGRQMGRDFIVENKPGASGNIAGASVARSKPDGNTLLFASSTHATSPALYSSLNYDPQSDFVSVGIPATTPYVLVVNPQLPVRSVEELTAHAEKHPGAVSFATSSPGTGQHLAAEVYKAEAGIDILHIPYKGSSASLPDLLSGRVDMMFDNVAIMLPHIRSGALIPLAVTSSERFRLLPDVPTMAESGHPDFNVIGWFSLLAPADTPAQAYEALNEALNAAVKSESVERKMLELGAEPTTVTVEEANAYLDEEFERWGEVIKEMDLQLG